MPSAKNLSGYKIESHMKKSLSLVKKAHNQIHFFFSFFLMYFFGRCGLRLIVIYIDVNWADDGGIAHIYVVRFSAKILLS